MPNSRLIEVRFAAQNPQLAAQIVNAHLQNYIEQNFRSKYDATTQASTWLSSELEELRIKVEKSEDARLAYERENQIWQIDEKQDITTQKLGRPQQGGDGSANGSRSRRKLLYRMAISGNVDALPAALSNGVVQDLLKRKSHLDQHYADAINQYGPNFPKVLRLAAQQKEVDADLAKARKTMVQSVEEDYNTAQSHLALLQEALDKQKADANDLAEKLVQYNILQHDAESNKQLYDGLLQKLKEAGITAGLRSSNIRVVDPALVPTTPSRPQKAKNILLALLVGLVGGIGLAIFREYLDNTVKSPTTLKSDRLALPCSCALLAGIEWPSRQAIADCAGGDRATRFRPSRGIACLRSTEISNLRGVSSASNVAAAFASRAPAPGDSGNQRAASRRKDDRCRESRRNSRAVGRSHFGHGR